MPCSTLMVHLHPNRSNAAVLQMADDLAARDQSAVIGIAARQRLRQQLVFAEGYVSAALFDEEDAAVAAEMTAAQAEFRDALQARVATLEWRSRLSDAPPCDTLAEEVRSADLLIVAAASGDGLDASRALNLGNLVMRAGRPVLVVPAAGASHAWATKQKLQRVVVGWNDTREARRAIVDALPLMRAAAHVAVVAIAHADLLAATRPRLAEVAAWLGRHGIAAEPVVSAASGDTSVALQAIAKDHGADLIVAGAYGHSRLREWVLGGVTRDLLLRADRCVLLSH